MAEFKLVISDPKSGKTMQREVKDQSAKPFIGLKIGDSIKGEAFDLTGYEFTVTGGSDYCGFPMRKGIQTMRKRIVASGGVGFAGKNRGYETKDTYIKKTVCGEGIHDKITQINLKITKQGKTVLFEEKKAAETAPATEKKE
jgi:small subunit ribosomal protein S6e